VCMLLCYSQIQYRHMVTQKQVQDLLGLDYARDQRTWLQVREECGHGEGVGVYVTLLQSDTVQTYGRTKAGTRPVGVGLRKRPKDLIASERGVWSWGGCGCVCYSSSVRYSTDIWSHKSRYKTCGGWTWLCKKPKDLIVSEREERGRGQGVSTENVNESALSTTYDMVCSRKTSHHLWRSTAFAILPGCLHTRPFLVNNGWVTQNWEE
jgi:hypothetical protein